jgi:hypothetical protein
MQKDAEASRREAQAADKAAAQREKDAEEGRAGASGE